MMFCVGLLAGFVVISPVLYALSLSFMSQAELTTYPPKLFSCNPSLRAYHEALESAPLLWFVFNSLFVSIAVTFGQIIISSLAAYGFAFFNFPAKKFLFFTVLSTMMIPGEVTIMANYLTIAQLNWLNTYQALIVPHLVTAMGIFLLRQYYLTLPVSLKEAATLDGCGHARFYLSIVLPLTQPAAASLGILVFLRVWNQYLWPLLVTNNTAFRTVQIGVRMLQAEEKTDYTVVLAGVIIVLIPSVIIYALGQKKLIGGMMEGALKG